MLKKDVIVRKAYLNAIRPFIDVNIIKIIAGVRRSGKSYVLDMLGDELIAKGVSRDHVVYRLFASVEFTQGYGKVDLFRELKTQIVDGGRYYFLLDEVQEVEGWEQAINTLFETGNVDIYVTGSNSKLTSEKISSYLSGRYVLLPVYTLSFAEYCVFKGISKDQWRDAFSSYVRFGGFPLIATTDLDTAKAYEIVNDIYHSVIAKDVMKNHPIRDIDKFDRLVKYVMDSMGKTFSANSIASYFKSQRREISVESIYNYLSWLQEAFIIYPCYRYDLRGKSILKTQEKYYLSDISLRYALFGYNASMTPSVLENILFLELKRRGYEVYVGKNGDKEIDFIAKKRDETLEIQAAIRLPIDSNREIGNLLELKDSYHKYVVTMEDNDVQNVQGVQVVHVVDFLTMEKW
ncbi:MAG: ATP-binding protein [Candidatus Enteromonas sp.]